MKAGQFVAYMGDSGDAEDSVPHLHFEIRRPDDTAIDPYTSPALGARSRPRAAVQCRCPTLPAPHPSTAASGAGYWTVERDRRRAARFGAAQSLRRAHRHRRSTRPITGIDRAHRPATATGYWVTDGGIFSFGDAPFYGSTGAMHLNQPIVGMAATPIGQRLLAARAPTAACSASATRSFYGSTGAMQLNAPIIAHGRDARPATATGSTRRDGGVFSFGDAELLRIDRRR